MKLKLKYLAYVVAFLLFVGWGWTTLYLHSYTYLWGGKDDSAPAAAAAKKKVLSELASLQKNGASPESLYEEREQVVWQCAQNNDHDDVRKFIDEEDSSLKSLAPSEERSKLLLYDRLLLAHICIAEGRYDEARDHLKEGSAILKELENQYTSDDCQLLSLTIANENAILDYLDANGTLDSKTRAALFLRSRKTFTEIIARIDVLKSESSKYSDELQTKIAKLKSRAITNLNMVNDDIEHEDEFQHS